MVTNDAADSDAASCTSQRCAVRQRVIAPHWSAAHVRVIIDRVGPQHRERFPPRH